MDVAVIGAGRWGRLHAQKIAGVRGARLAAVVDADLERAMAVTAEFGGRALEHVSELPKQIGAATVAVPLAALAPTAETLLERGIPTLIEKPMATEVKAARRLVELAQRRDVCLAVGFLERYNPNLVTCAGAPWVICRRVGPSSAVEPLELDWLVHDIDLASWLLGARLTVERARWWVDGVELRLRTADGRRAAVGARVGRVARRHVRTADLRMDLQGHTGDPLAAQLADFCHVAAGGCSARLARGIDALAVLEILQQAHSIGRSAAA